MSLKQTILDAFKSEPTVADMAKPTGRLRMESKSHVPTRLWESMIWGNGNVGTSRWDKKAILEQAYERNAPFFAAVNIIAQTVADIPVVVRCTHQGKRINSPDHPILKVFERSETRAEYITRYCKYYAALGTAYSEIIMSSRGKPLGAVVMPSQFTRNVQGDYRRPIVGYEYMENTRVFIPEDRVVHLYSPSLMRYFEEISPAVPLAELIALNNAAITWNKNVAQKGGMPSIVGVADYLDDVDAQAIKERWEEQSGAGKSHQLKLMSGNIDLKKLNDNPHDAEWEKAVMMSMRMIFMAMGVSSSLMNDAGNKTYNNVHDARKALFTELSIPIARRIWEAHTRKLQRYYEDNPEIIVDTQNIEAIQEDKKIAIERLQRAVDAGILTANEARAELGYPNADGPTANMLQNSKIINNIPKVDVNAERNTDPNLDQEPNPEQDENQD